MIEVPVECSLDIHSGAVGAIEATVDCILSFYSNGSQIVKIKFMNSGRDSISG